MMTRALTNGHVRDALANVDRRYFCKSEASAYIDAPQRIGWGVTISVRVGA
jgi:protein-L-isoaspartate O-methyltransferase